MGTRYFACLPLTNENPITVRISHALRKRTGIGCRAKPGAFRPRHSAGHTSHGKRIAGSSGA